MSATRASKKKSATAVVESADAEQVVDAVTLNQNQEPSANHADSALPAATAPTPVVAAAEPAPDTPDSSGSEPDNDEPEEQAPAFRALGLSEPVMRAIIEAGFEAPTPIQEQSIPILLQGHDLIGQAQTGTGKTAAFALPMAEKLDSKQPHPQAIVLLPTRELCIQVAQETHSLSKYCRLRVVPIYGGQPIDRQFRALSMGAQIVVGTPGRVLDHLRRGTLKLNQVRMVVLDEADEMLNMGFLEDVEEILKEAPAERQTALFSATMPPRIAALARDYLRNPERVTIESKRRTVAQIQQTYYEVAPAQKVEALSRILDMETPGSTILFCRTRREVDELGEALQTRGYEAETLHGEMNQAARDRVMNRFRSGQADLLIATDVAARGLDIDQVTHVINYDIPWDVESYIHRIGRTGRAGRSGEAITLISPRERRQLKLIERYINAPIRPARVPTTADIVARRRDIFKDSLKQMLVTGAYDGFLPTVEQICAEGEYDASQLAAAAMQMLWQSQKGGVDYDVNEAAVEVERSEPGMTRLFLQIGRQDGVRPGDIVGAIANEAGVPGNAIGIIDIMDRSTFVEVPEAEAARVIDALSRTKLRGKKVYVDVARPRREEDGASGGGPRRDYDGDRGDRDFRGGDRDFRGGGRDFNRPNYGGHGGYGREDRYSRPPSRHHDNPVPRPRRKP
jgi:ATP-dependent RNA helicase DeaD